MPSPLPSLPKEILSLIIRTAITSLQDDPYSINTCTSLRLVCSFFNDTILHELFIHRRHSEDKLHSAYLDYYPSQFNKHCFSFFLVWRYFQGALTQFNIHNTLERYRPFFASVHEAINSLRPLLHDPTHLDASPQSIFRVGTTARFSSRDPVFNDLPSLLVSAAITSFCVPGIVLRIVIDAGMQDEYLEARIAESISLGPELLVFITACYIGEVDLARQVMPQAFKNANSNEKLHITDPVFVRCLLIAVEEDHADIFQFLLDVGVDPNVVWRNSLVLADVVRTGRLDLLQMLLRSPHGLQKFDECSEEVVVHAAKLKDVRARHTMVDALLTHGLCNDETAVRQEALTWAFLYSDLRLAEKMLEEDPDAAVYRAPISPDIVYQFGRGQQSNVELIRLIFRNIQKFAPTPEDRLQDLQKAEVSAINYASKLADFKELLGFLTSPSPVQRFLAACCHEGGIAEVEKRDGILDLGTPTSRADIMPWECDTSNRSFTLGAQALKRAIYSGVMANVEILLHRDIRVAEEIRADAEWVKTDITKFQTLQNLLSKEGGPRVVIVDGSWERQVLWEPEHKVTAGPEQ